EHYISFDLKHANWDRIVEENRAKITAKTTPLELFDVLKGMIEPFGDAHTFIGARKLKKQFQGFRTGPGLDKFGWNQAAKVFEGTNRAYLQGPLTKYCNGQLQYGHLNPTTGYLRIAAF